MLVNHSYRCCKHYGAYLLGLLAQDIWEQIWDLREIQGNVPVFECCFFGTNENPSSKCFMHQEWDVFILFIQIDS